MNFSNNVLNYFRVALDYHKTTDNAGDTLQNELDDIYDNLTEDESDIVKGFCHDLNILMRPGVIRKPKHLQTTLEDTLRSYQVGDFYKALVSNRNYPGNGLQNERRGLILACWSKLLEGEIFSKIASVLPLDDRNDAETALTTLIERYGIYHAKKNQT